MAPATLKPIAKRTLQDTVYEQLRLALMAGAFPPGSSMTLRGMAAQLGTSIMPIRDAVRRLVSDQALVMVTSRQIRVPTMALERFESVLRVRVLLEGEAAARAAEMATAADVERLVELNKEAVAATGADIARMLAANQSFHFAVYDLADDRLLRSLIEKTWLLSGPYLTLVRESLPGDARSTRVGLFREHDALIRAIRDHDTLGAQRAVRADIENTAERYRSRIVTLSSVPQGTGASTVRTGRRRRISQRR